MAESRLVPCSILKWPEIADLLPDQKLIWVHMWFGADNSSGCYLYAIGAAAGELSLSVPALKEAVRRFKKDTLIDFDPDSGEIMILDWFRWHSFDGYRLKIVQNDIQKIRSERLRKLTLEKLTYYVASTRRSRSISRSRSELPPLPAPTSADDSGGSIFGSLIVEPSIAHHFPRLISVLTDANITDPVFAQNVLDELVGTIEA